jgi:hypothetical protein
LELEIIVFHLYVEGDGLWFPWIFWYIYLLSSFFMRENMVTFMKKENFHDCLRIQKSIQAQFIYSQTNL